jgi:phosphopantothenoylcysteine decarboxylase/phosphopantothenate--cysteine ligase
LAFPVVLVSATHSFNHIASFATYIASMSRNVVVGVSGGIAAYKAATLVSRLVQRGLNVSVVLSDASQQFVGPATFAALCNRAPVTSAFDTRYPLGPHIELATNCHLFVMAPATAHMIASCAWGLADCLLSTLYLHMECPVVFAPAMSAPMWSKPAVARNVEQLQRDGVHLVGPEVGWLSCRAQGPGRMAEPDDIVLACEPFLK